MIYSVYQKFHKIHSHNFRHQSPLNISSLTSHVAFFFFSQYWVENYIWKDRPNCLSRCLCIIKPNYLTKLRKYDIHKKIQALQINYKDEKLGHQLPLFDTATPIFLNPNLQIEFSFAINDQVSLQVSSSSPSSLPTTCNFLPVLARYCKLWWGDKKCKNDEKKKIKG